MRRAISVLSVATLMVSLAVGGVAHAAPAAGHHHAHPVVSGAWLDSHRDLSGLVVLDVRPAADYAAGHIEGAVNVPFEVPFSAWVTMRDELLLELPDAAELSDVLGDVGITEDSWVVVVTSYGQPPYPQANATRVAVTLTYAGLRRVSILDGGFPQWLAEGRATTTDVPVPEPLPYAGVFDPGDFVGTDYVQDRIGRSLILDARDAEVYSGEVVEPWADQPGHIPSAVSLPAPLIWNDDGTYKSRDELRGLVYQALGRHRRTDEIIVYCGVGGYASAWQYVLTAVLGYRNVKLYDGSAQEWVRYYDLVL